MSIEIEISRGRLDNAHPFFESAASSESVLVIRGGARVHNKDEWVTLLKSEFGLIQDRRHYDPSWAAAAAKATEDVRQGSVAAPPEQAGAGASSTQQFAPADWWEISYQPDRELAYAYAKSAQPLHSDNAWFKDPAEINFFIMQKQAVRGGEQLVYPASRLLDDLAQKDQPLLKDLTTVPVVIRKGEHDFFNETTIIREGAQPRLFWNFYRTERSSPEVDRMCTRFFEFLSERCESTSVERVHLGTGDCLAFNDLHMLHGRTAYEATKPKDRVLLHSMWKLPPGPNHER